MHDNDTPSTWDEAAAQALAAILTAFYMTDAQHTRAAEAAGVSQFHLAVICIPRLVRAINEQQPMDEHREVAGMMTAAVHAYQALVDLVSADYEAKGMPLTDADISAYLETTLVAPENIVNVLVERHTKYGVHNILSTGGLAGIRVRLSDKAARLVTAAEKHRGDFTDETLVDTLIDIIGYAVIAVMLHRGQFELPLKCDLHDQFDGIMATLSDEDIAAMRAVFHEDQGA